MLEHNRKGFSACPFCLLQSRTARLHLVNEANIVMLLKKVNAMTLGDYGLINLMNNFMKMIMKALAKRLSFRFNELVSCSQNAFIKGRFIHHNFLYVNMIRSLHNKKRSTLFIKLDILRPLTP